jgi:hypothetical protein
MDLDTLTLLLPIAWAITATLIGLLLYKSSTAFFDQSTNANQQTKRIRLTGSVVIAALAFYGLKLTTPAERLLGSRKDMVTVDINALERVKDSSRTLDRAVLEVQGCVATTLDSTCERKITELKIQSTALVQTIANMGQKSKQ